MNVTSQIIKLIIASIVGFVVGIERSKRQKTAGVGTFSIICITSCFLTIMAVYEIPNSADPSRLIANIITAIGFVAGGTIFTVGIGKSIKVSGLTTGAEIFSVASLGIGVGLGLYEIVITVVILIEINIYFAKLTKKHYKRKKGKKVKSAIEVISDDGLEESSIEEDEEELN